MIKIGMVIGDRYEVLEKIGTGGMSDVYKARDHKLNRLVAVKVLKQEFSENENFVSKFRVEAQSTAGLMHPNIVNVYDVGDEDGVNYIVMELVDGITLKKYIEKKSRLSVKEAVSIAIQVAMGLEAAHNNNIIHRDIKPQNIMISKEGKVKVTDFGIAKAATSNTITSNVMGSVHYTSPEQARGGYSDAKSDIYSLGITLFEMLTGRVPFNGDTTVAIAIKHIQEDLPSPADYNDDIPISVEKIVLKCCQKSPDRRYQNAAELIADLKRSLITPDKDFVALVDPDEEGATRVATQDETNSVKSGNGRLSDTEQMRLKEDAERDYDRDYRDKSDEDYDRDRRRRKRDYEDEEDDFLEYDRNRYRNKDPQGPGRMEKLTIVMAIVLAVLIAFMGLLLVARKIGFMGGSDAGAEGSSAASVASSVTSSDTAENADGIIIPDVSNKTYAEAVSELNAKGFKVEKGDDANSTLAKGVVSYTNPAAGNRARSGATVSVFVSTGANASSTAAAAATEVSVAKADGQVSVPNVIGMSSEDAVITLVEAGLTAGTVVETSNEDPNLTGKICAQSIAYGTSVSEGTTINMELSTGPASVTYSYTADISAPTEGENYQSGVSVHVTLVTSDGTTLLNTTTSDFPIQMNSKGITSPTGTLTFVYTATAPTSTNPETGETTGGETKEVTVTRAVTFTQEN